MGDKTITCGASGVVFCWFFFVICVGLMKVHLHPPTATLPPPPSHLHPLTSTVPPPPSHLHPPTATLPPPPSHLHRRSFTLPPPGAGRASQPRLPQDDGVHVPRQVVPPAPVHVDTQGGPGARGRPRYATQASNPRRADRVPGTPATHTFEPRLGQASRSSSAASSSASSPTPASRKSPGRVTPLAPSPAPSARASSVDACAASSRSRGHS